MKKSLLIILLLFLCNFLLIGQSIDLVNPYEKFASVDTTIVFQWNPLPSAFHYEIQIDTNNNFASLVYNQSNISSTEITLPLANNHTYFWRIRYFNGNTYSTWSDYNQFTIFNPKAIPNLELWLDPNNGVVLGTLNEVNQWNDLSVNANNASQPITTKRPKLISNIPILNNNNVIRFDGASSPSDDHLILNNPINMAPSTLFMTTKKSIASNAYFFGNQSKNYIAVGHAIPSNTFFANFTGASPDALILTNNNLLQYSIITTKYNAAQYSLRINENLIGSSPYSGVGSINIIGKRVPTSQGLNGDMGEILLYSAPLSDSIIHLIERYLKFKYAPPVNLGQDTILNSGYCINKTLNAGDHFITYNWSTGATTKSINITKAGNYSVTVTNVFGQTSVDTFKVIHERPNLQKNITICESSSISFDSYVGNNYSYSWNDTLPSSQINISKAGKYIYKITDQNNCFISDTIFVQVDSLKSKISLGNDTTLCPGQAIGLVAGTNLVQTYQWSTGAITDTIQVNSTGSYILTVTNINNCVATDTINVTLLGGVPPVADFSYSNTCLGDTISFIDLSTSSTPIINYLWNFGDGNSGSAPSPHHIYGITGIYNVQLQVINSVGCADEIVKTIEISSYPVLNTDITGHCTASQISFSDFSYVPGGFVTDVKWNFGDGDSSTVNNPNHIYQQAGDYYVDFTATSDKGCTASITDTIKIYEAPVAGFTYDPICVNMNMQYWDTSKAGDAPITSWFWNFGNGKTSFSQNTQVYYGNAATYNVQLTVTDTNICKSLISVPVTVYPAPIADFTKDTTCINTSFTFSDMSTAPGRNVAQWFWDLGNGIMDTGVAPSVTFENTGNYPVKLNIITDIGCTDSITREITVIEQPTASFEITPSYGAAPLYVKFINQSTGADQYEWYVDTSFISSDISPDHVFTEDRDYTITLVVLNKFGCTDTITKMLNVEYPVLDLAVENLQVIQELQDDGSYKLSFSVRLINNGTRKITSADLYATYGGGSTIIETWTGTLDIQKEINYTFTSSFYIPNVDNRTFLCVDAKLVNNEKDAIQENNIQCLSVTEEFKIMNPYPNPANDKLTLRTVTPASDFLQVQIYNSYGQRVLVIHDDIVPRGLNQFNVNTSMLPMGIYYIRSQYRKEYIVKPFIIQR